MRAIHISRAGDASVLEYEEAALPQPSADQVLIRVHAAGVNRSDLLLREGGYGIDPTGQIPGLEIAGIIEKCGANVERWKVGDRVCALLSGGGYAEYAVANGRHCLPMQPGQTFLEAASLPETVMTVWSTVFQWGHLQSGENFLVHGGTSGIGMVALQLARAFGAHPFATAGSDAKCAAAEKFGAEKCVNYKNTDFEKAFEGTPMDVILDMVGGDYTPKNLRLLAMDGRMMFVNSMNGAESQIHIPTLMQKRLTLAGSMLKPRSDDFKAQLTCEVEAQVWPLLLDGRLKSVIYRSLPLDDAAKAHELMATSEHVGKIMLEVN